MSAELPLYTWEEIRKHNTDKDCWVVLYNKVLDVTKFLNHHPGGLDPINDLGGYNITNSFESIGHSEFALEKSKSFIIGAVDPKSKEPVTQRKAGTSAMSVSEMKKFTTKDPLANVKKGLVAFIVLIIAYYVSQYF